MGGSFVSLKNAILKEHCFPNEGMLRLQMLSVKSLDYKNFRKTQGKHVNAVSLIGLKTSLVVLKTMSIFKAGFYFLMCYL